MAVSYVLRERLALYLLLHLYRIAAPVPLAITLAVVDLFRAPGVLLDTTRHCPTP